MPSLIQGTIVAIDETHGTFQIHHDPFPAMPMAMTMIVKPRHRTDLRTLHVGERIAATVDLSSDPWNGWDIRPAPGRSSR